MSTLNEDDDLEAGFGSDITAGRSATDTLEDDAPKAVEEPKQAEEQTAETPPEPDPLAGLPQAVKDMLADYQRTKVDIENLRRTAGQVPALQARLDKLAAHQPPPAADKPRFEKVAKLRDEGLPEIADALEELASALPPKSEPAPAPDSATTTETPAKVASVDDQLEVLDEVRPGWSDIVFGNGFQLWLSTQTPQKQAEVRGASKAKVILSALKEFDQHQARTQQVQQTSDARTRRMAAAVTPRGDGRTLARQTVEDDEDADLEAGFRRPAY